MGSFGKSLRDIEGEPTATHIQKKWRTEGTRGIEARGLNETRRNAYFNQV